MEINIDNRTEIIHQYKVYQINLEIDGRKTSIKSIETEIGFDNYVLFHDMGFWMDFLDIADNDLKNTLEVIAYNITDSMFSSEARDIDISKLPKPNKLHQ